MQISYKQNGMLNTLKKNSMVVDFEGMGFFTETDGVETEAILKPYDNGFVGVSENLTFRLEFSENNSFLAIDISVENKGDKPFSGKIGLHTGINSYMADYPQWHTAWFPTLLRCEKTHLWGYYMNTEENSLAIATSAPVASYDINYNRVESGDYGHRILGTDIIFFQNTKLPSRHPQNLKQLNGGEIYKNTVFLALVENKQDIMKTLNSIADIPFISAEKYTLEKGENITCEFIGDIAEKTVILPDGSAGNWENLIVNDFGEYTLKAKAVDGKECEAKFYCRKDWGFYLKNAAKQALLKPQKASTHVESFYGLFSCFLEGKRSGDSQLLEKAENCFNEIFPLMFDLEKCVPIVIPERIQNTALFISLLTDMFEALGNEKYLRLAAGFADWLIRECQDEKGIYRCGGIHYTCVIYVAKSMIELALAEKDCGIEEFQNKYEAHYNSAKRAIDELASSLDNIETEGESTLEDGMISCSALQIGMLALTLPENERAPYIEAAEKMMKIHSCLEQQLIPDCRMNGASLRYWESQYDVMVMNNMLNSPHGWSGWTAYAHYYLYMLTGKKNYLLSLMNVLGSSAQLMSLDGNLRWAFCAQPYVKADTWVCDLDNKIEDGYEYVYAAEQAYGGKYEMREYCEEYVEMISGWYRIGEQKVTGGYLWLPLFLENGVVKKVNNQGGCCDNDVHEIFKCIEETVLGKAFIYENEDGSLLCYGCKGVINDNSLQIDLFDGVTEVCYNLKNQYKCNLASTPVLGFETLKLS